MNSFLITLIVFLCCTCGILLGTYIRVQLPAHHLSEESKDIVKLSTGLIATLTALILGLLVASANDTFQSFNDGLDKIGADLLIMDRSLAFYGPEAKLTRDALRKLTVVVLMNNWPDDQDQTETHLTPEELAGLPNYSQTKQFVHGGASEALRGADALSNIQNMLLRLEPKDNAQRWRQARALEVSGSLAEKRWLMG